MTGYDEKLVKTSQHRKTVASIEVMRVHSIPESSLYMIDRFVAIFGHAAVAHSREELTDEEMASLEACARGELDEVARRELISLLAHNTTALEYFAALLKASGTEDTSTRNG